VPKRDPFVERALGAGIWGRRVARLPERGVLLVATDLQGNFADYEALKRIHAAEGPDTILAFCGDLVHGPSPELNEPGAWPDYLGTAFVDRSKDLILDFDRYTRSHRAFSLLGNHEHAHIGGPVVSKFYPDEAAVLDGALGDERVQVHAFLRDFPLIAVSRAGLVLTHGAPGGTERSIEDFEALRYDGYEAISILEMYRRGTVGSLLWARAASPESARRLLAATLPEASTEGVVAYGHDVVREGYEKVGAEQICVSTSYGLHDRQKVYLRIDLSRRYRSTDDLREGIEILTLYPEPADRQ
jgi:hypothetical protein